MYASLVNLVGIGQAVSKATRKHGQRSRSRYSAMKLNLPYLINRLVFCAYRGSSRTTKPSSFSDLTLVERMKKSNKCHLSSGLLCWRDSLPRLVEQTWPYLDTNSVPRDNQHLFRSVLLYSINMPTLVEIQRTNWLVNAAYLRNVSEMSPKCPRIVSGLTASIPQQQLGLQSLER